MREKAVEDYLINQVVKHGGHSKKLTSRRGDPDRIVLWPVGTLSEKAEVHFIELKAPTGEASDIQLYELGKLKQQGFLVYILYRKEHVDLYIKYHFNI